MKLLSVPRPPNKPFCVTRVAAKGVFLLTAFSLFLSAAVFASYRDPDASSASDWAARGFPLSPACSAAEMKCLSGFSDVRLPANKAVECVAGFVVKKPFVLCVAGAQNQIINVVVLRIEVFVVHDLFGSQVTTYFVCHDPPVTVDVFFTVPNRRPTADQPSVVFGKRFVRPRGLATTTSAKLDFHGTIVASKVIT
jgi:hypothetical protein